ncbi:MAG: tubulin-like doman-containing protein [Saprospiraceae bacterium]|nr:tubulin-like doman-containing protein [Saprospiraceae bacterium]
MNHKDILFIGLGGHAGRIITGIKKELKPFQKSHNLHYLLIDLERYHNLDNKIIDENEFIFFGGINPKKYVEEIINKGFDSIEYQELNSFFPIDQSFFVESIPDRPIEKGAGRKRLIGRLLLYSKKQSVENKVNKILRQLANKDDDSQPNVVVISSCCGGTGSSIFYDILNLFSSPSINLYPIVIGPSLLVEKNKDVSKGLSNKIKMNAMAFFEELNLYNRFTKYNFSFFSNKATNLNLRYIIFYDNLLDSESRIAINSLKEFEDYISKCTSMIFNGSYKKGKEDVVQDIWANIENISDDMMNELKEVQNNAVRGLLEPNNFISFGYPRNKQLKSKKSMDSHLLDILETLTDKNTTGNHQLMSKDDILETVDGDLFKESKTNSDPWNRLVSKFNKMNPKDIHAKYIEDFIPETSSKIINLEALKEYLTDVNSKITEEESNNSRFPALIEDEPKGNILSDLLKKIYKSFNDFFSNSTTVTNDDEVDDINENELM